MLQLRFILFHGISVFLQKLCKKMDGADANNFRFHMRDVKHDVTDHNTKRRDVIGCNKSTARIAAQYGSYVFARWRQIVPLSNTRPCAHAVCSPNGISIGSAVFAGIASETNTDSTLPQSLSRILNGTSPRCIM